MAYRNEADDTPVCLTDLMDFISENTGLLGDENPGSAHFNAGGSVVMITSDRPSFDHHDILLRRIEESPELQIEYIGIKKSFDFDKPHPHLEVVQA